jgi:hypothetical protein
VRNQNIRHKSQCVVHLIHCVADLSLKEPQNNRYDSYRQSRGLGSTSGGGDTGDSHGTFGPVLLPSSPPAAAPREQASTATGPAPAHASASASTPAPIPAPTPALAPAPTSTPAPALTPPMTRSYAYPSDYRDLPELLPWYELSQLERDRERESEPLPLFPFPPGTYADRAPARQRLYSPLGVPLTRSEVPDASGNTDNSPAVSSYLRSYNESPPLPRLPPLVTGENQAYPFQFQSDEYWQQQWQRNSQPRPWGAARGRSRTRSLSRSMSQSGSRSRSGSCASRG